MEPEPEPAGEPTLTAPHSAEEGVPPGEGDEAAAAAGMPFIGVATGVFTVEDLRETGAVLVVADLAESLDAVVAAIEGL